MTVRLVASVLVAALSVSSLGCASTSAKPAFDDVNAVVEARSGHRMRWNEDSSEDREAERAIDDLLQRDLSADGAVQVALLGSPRLRAKLEELAIARADLVQAGLLKNPVFSVGRTAWESEHIAPNLFATVELDFLDILTMPLRKRVAATQLEATKLEVADEVLELAAEARSAYYEAQASAQIVAMRRLVEDAASASGDLARAQNAAGNMSDLARDTELSLSAQTSLDRRRAEGNAALARERLNKVMGTWGPRTGWHAAPKLPDVPNEDPKTERLESIAIERRLDIAAARRNVQALGYALSLAKTTRWTGTVDVAVEAGRLRNNRRIAFGPSVRLEIPLFDQRRAQIAKLEAYERQARNELSTLAIDVRADVRAAKARLVTARAVVDQLAKVMIPLRENVVRFSQEQYDAMLIGVYQLIQSKRAEFEAYSEYIEAVRDYWIARSDLERAIGARLVSADANTTERGGAATIAPPDRSDRGNR